VATDFFERQAAARRSTAWLRLAFAFAFVTMIGAVSLVTLLATAVATRVSPAHAFTLLTRHPESYLRFTLVVGLLMLAVTVVRAWKLRGGGGALAEALGGRRIHAQTSDPDERRLLNVVEEMSLAARLRTPAVYVLDHERSINAFAAGRTLDDAAIGVTAGALAAFDREELQALIGHELSHLLNGDTALNTRMVAWLYGLHAPTLFAKGMLRGKNGRFDPRAFVAWPLILGLYAIGSVGTLLGRALQATISRRREQLADAAAVQYTRNPQALRAVLLKIACSDEIAPLGSRDATAAAHMMFSSVDLGWLGRIGGQVFATHPTPYERVRALDPTMTDVRFRVLAREARAAIGARREAVAAARAVRVAANAEQSAQRRAQAGATGGAAADVGGRTLSLEGAIVEAPLAAPPAPAESSLGAATRFDGLWHRMTREQQQAITAIVERHGVDAERLELLLVAALLAPAEASRAAQLRKLAGAFGAGLAARVEPVRIEWQSLPQVARLAAILQLLPQVRGAEERVRARWLRVVSAYARIARPVDTTTFAITRVLRHALAPRRAAPAGPHPALVEQADAIGVLFSLLAHENGAGALDAYRHGLQDVLPPQRRPPLLALPIEAARVDAAFEALATLHVAARRAIGAGLARTVARNRVLSVGEADWLRATAVLLDTPVPVIPLDLRLEAAATA
jgi:Zn-dependent protease with chaperone function